ncbi:MAG: isoaspartyl peptidase/L-asparaginase family protein [Thermaurantimonas sp.]|uniref:Isoaspartyl peptidase n=1 Tax=Thermaurantimonas aggregans TaxID=2173829 RepID=A0A401XKS2_9FLAO|nr:isoaspartyl peptidase/L-asparaginase [Thermaurantimonas aggregans]MCX8147922.1 isoaspartyl peptidase/L-asparaginase [Thermaurantimonas aggregans]GCD77584.1 isoaspartyl peptidase/L-asparaginase [Thermaurantimonas aggregans]
MLKNVINAAMLFSFLNLFGQIQNFGLVLHGGAGYMALRNNPEKVNVYLAALNAALDSGYSMLQRGESAEQVVIHVVMMLENNTLFNAGRGAVLTEEGIAELDASIMTGYDQKAGAVSGLRHVKNPILAAQAVKDKTQHVMLSGAGAEKFIFSIGLDSVPNSYFITDDMRARWEEALKNQKYGTVGCVALDKDGNLAAGTSTGGMLMKKFGRIGDAPIIGAGTYAKNGLIAVSCTGHGEYFIRTSAAYQVAARMRFGRQKASKAIRSTLEEIKNLGGSGGMIAIDDKGNLYHDYNTEGMFRAGRNSKGNRFAKIYE